MKETIVDRLYNQFRDIVRLLDQQSEVSLRVTAEDIFRKTLLIAVASHFEQEMKDHITNLVRKHTEDADVIVEFVRNKAVARQFYTYFDWDRRNANKFFALFGEGFKSYMIKRVSTDQSYEQAVVAFLELGNERNSLVHEDFGNFTMQKTSEDIFCLYKKASIFVNSLESSFDDYLSSTQSL